MMYDYLAVKKRYIDWLIDWAVKLPGIKVLVRDHLASHFFIDVISVCLQNDVQFISFIPNTMHLCQPLDIAIFRPTKVLWQHILQPWRSKTSKGTIPKETFPSFLKQVFVNLKSENLVSSFRACGIVPFDDLEQVLNRLPGANNKDRNTSNSADLLNDSCLSFLKQHCSAENSKQRKSQGPKVAPWKSITSLPNKENEAPKHKKAKQSTAALVNEDADNWICFCCGIKWEDDDNWWVVCDLCDKPYHLQCSGSQ